MTRYALSCLCAWLWAVPTLTAETPTYLLQTELEAGDGWQALIELEVGGQLLVPAEAGPTKLPLSVSGKLQYEERLLSWSESGVARSLRYYDQARAKIQIEDGGLQRTLPATARTVIAEIRDRHSALNGLEHLLTREQMDLLQVVGNTLALQRLIPGRSFATGDSWSHPPEAIGPLLGLDYVAVCEVQSVVLGATRQQVQIRLSGTVHGTIDGAPTEFDLRGAYLFHQGLKRITKFNLALQERRTAGAVVPGVDVVAKVSIRLQPLPATSHLQAKQVELASAVPAHVKRDLLLDTPSFRLQHDKAWYVTADQGDMVSLRYLHDGDLVAHCNLTTLPPRSADRGTTLDQFEREVRTALDGELEKVTAASQWTTPLGNHCLGIVAVGQVQDVPMQWRYYLIQADGLPRVSLAVTLAQAALPQFRGAERQLVNSLELKPATAAAKQPVTAVR